LKTKHVHDYAKGHK